MFIFPNISLFKTCDPGAGPFLPQGHNLNKIGRGLLPNSKALGLVVSNEKIITCLAYIRLCETSEPRGGPFFGLQDII